MKPVVIRQDIRQLAEFVRSHFDPKGESVSPYSGVTVSDTDRRFDEGGNIVDYLNAFERMEARFTSEFYFMDVENERYPNGRIVEIRGRRCKLIKISTLKYDLQKGKRGSTKRLGLSVWHSDLLTTFDKLEELERAINKYAAFQTGKTQYQTEQLSIVNNHVPKPPEVHVEPTETHPSETKEALPLKHKLSGLTSYRQIALWHYYTWETGEKQRPPVKEVWLKEAVAEMGKKAKTAWRQLRDHLNDLPKTLGNPTSNNITDHEAIIPFLTDYPNAEKLAKHKLHALKEK